VNPASAPLRRAGDARKKKLDSVGALGGVLGGIEGGKVAGNAAAPVPGLDEPR
jgi:hypothetical protein